MSIASELLEKFDNGNESIKKITLKKVFGDRLKFLKAFKLDSKKSTFLSNSDGSGSFIVQLPDNGENQRFEKDVISKMIKDKTFRWMDINAIGY